MYAVIKTGGKQYRVEEGQTLEVELLHTASGEPAVELEMSPVLVVDGETVLSTPGQLSDAKVSVKVVGEAKGPKITGYTYKNKTNSSRRWGHRQRYSRIEITGIKAG